MSWFTEDETAISFPNIRITDKKKKKMVTPTAELQMRLISYAGSGNVDT